MKTPDFDDDSNASELGDIPDAKFGGAKRENLEMMPIQELRKRAHKRNIKDYENLNKQELIEALHNSDKK